MSEKGYCIVKSKTKDKLPRLPFLSIKNEVLGKDYQLSIAFVSPETQKKINFSYRKKNENTNILSFSLSVSSGEILINLDKAKEEAEFFGMTFLSFLKFLLIHGMLHLKGFEHSSTMEREEEKYLKIFS